MQLTRPSGLTSYWFATAAVSVALGFGGLSDVLHHPYADRTMTHLGFPLYFQVILGSWKLLAVPALLWPGLPHLKEWAYAGVFFDVSGAALAHAVRGDRLEIVAPIAVGLLLGMSWALRPASRRCQRLSV